MIDPKPVPGVIYQARIRGLMVTLQPGQSLAEWLAIVAQAAGKLNG